jgi:hypothetical protein
MTYGVEVVVVSPAVGLLRLVRRSLAVDGPERSDICEPEHRTTVTRCECAMFHAVECQVLPDISLYWADGPVPGPGPGPGHNSPLSSSLSGYTLSLHLIIYQTISINTELDCVRFEVLTAVTMKNVVFLHVTPCGSCYN